MHLIKPDRDIIIPSSAHSGFAGFFKIVARKPDGRERVLHDWQQNLITDAGLDNIGTGWQGGYTGQEHGWWYWCRVGTGSTPEAYTDTALDVHKAQAAQSGYPAYTQGAANATPPFYRWQRNQYTFVQGETAGLITEIGVGKKIGTGHLSTRALLRDTNGDPISVAVDVDDQLTVYYEMRCYIPSVAPVASQITISGIVYDTVQLPCKISDANNMNGRFTLGAGAGVLVAQGTTPWPNVSDHFGEPAGINQNMGGTNAAYTPGSYQMDSYFFARYTDIYWYPKGITACKITTNYGHFQQSYVQNAAAGGDPTWGIPKNNTNELTMWFRHTWDRYTPP